MKNGQTVILGGKEYKVNVNTFPTQTGDTQSVRVYGVPAQDRADALEWAKRRVWVGRVRFFPVKA